MNVLVQKYGGSSVGTPERIQGVSERIAQAHRQGIPLVVVVSAMGNTTDELIALAHQVSKSPPHREMDMLLSAGERISMALLSMALSERGISARSFTGSQTGIITTGSHRRARIRRILGDRVRAALGEGRVAIVAGFQGVSEEKEITTLGRGGSDTTAVALAASLGATACEIYTDVDGVFSADPRVVPGAHFLHHIRHDEMVEMATRGAGVLHPRSVELSQQFGVKLVVRNSLSPSLGEGTGRFTEVASPERGEMENFRVIGVTADKEKMLVNIELERPTVGSSIWSAAAESSLNVVAPFFMERKIQFFSDSDSQDEWRKRLDRLSLEGFVRSYEMDLSQVPLSVVGNRFSQDGAALQSILEVLAEHRIPVRMGSASALAITVAVPLNQADEGVRALHEKFVPSPCSKE